MHYLYNDWLQDIGWYFRQTMAGITTGGAERSLKSEFDAYFEQKYANPDDRAFYHRRMAAAITFIRGHNVELYQGVTALVGDQEALASRIVVITLHRIYAECPDEDLAEEPPLEWVLDRAKESYDAFKHATRSE